MTRSETYNGYRNYETWAVSLWLSNEEGSYRYWRDVAQEEIRETQRYWQVRGSAADAMKCRFADRLKEEVENGSPLTEASLYSDLLNSALSEVDWYEIAETFLEE